MTTQIPSVLRKLVPCTVLSIVVAAVMSGASEFTRSDIVDERVHLVAHAVLPHVPELPSLPSSTGCRFYPTIERLPLIGSLGDRTGEPAPGHEILLQASLESDRVALLFLLLLVSTLCWSVIAAWKLGQIDRERGGTALVSLMCRLTLVGTPFLMLLSMLYWPLVSFWGTLAFELADTRPGAPPIIDSPTTRGAIALGLWLSSAWATIAAAGVRPKAAHTSGAQTALAPYGDVPRSWDVPTAQGACGLDTARVRGRRSTRRAARVLLGGTITSLLCAPLIEGLARAMLFE